MKTLRYKEVEEEYCRTMEEFESSLSKEQRYLYHKAKNAANTMNFVLSKSLDDVEVSGKMIPTIL
jgi:hypothetical protein